MKKTIFYFILLAFNMVNLQTLSSQNTIDYWTFNGNTYTVETKNSSYQTISTKTNNLYANAFTYDNKAVYYKPEIAAKYLLGEEALAKLIRANLKVDYSASVIVLVCLIISNTGGVESAGVFRSGRKFEFDLQAVNFLKSLSWTPARQNGVTVRSMLFVPVRFENL